MNWVLCLGQAVAFLLCASLQDWLSAWCPCSFPTSVWGPNQIEKSQTLPLADQALPRKELGSVSSDSDNLPNMTPMARAPHVRCLPFFSPPRQTPGRSPPAQFYIYIYIIPAHAGVLHHSLCLVIQASRPEQRGNYFPHVGMRSFQVWLASFWYNSLPRCWGRLWAGGDGGGKGGDGWMASPTRVDMMSLSKLGEVVKDRGAWCAAVHGAAERTWPSNWRTTA